MAYAPDAEMGKMNRKPIIFIVLVFISVLSACKSASQSNGDQKSVLAVESFLADLSSQIAGDLVQVQTLIPAGIDLHGYQPSPQDIVRIENADLIIANGAGLEGWLSKILTSAARKPVLIEASAGIPLVNDDPHLWLDPVLVTDYVDTIQGGLTELLPEHNEQFAANAQVLKIKLMELDEWIRNQVNQIPSNRRILVTNHESLGYFATRYGFEVIGSIIPSHDALAETSALHLVELISLIKATGAPAIFLETGSNPQLALQLERETGIKVVSGLYTHSTDENAASYIDMIRANVTKIVDALQ